MVEGMDREQFLKFRMALLPASGFQSAQYRLIEICSTDLVNLTEQSYRQQGEESNLESLLEKLYWRKGATELASGKKTLTLRQFEHKYMKVFLDTALRYRSINLRKIYLKFFHNSDVVKSKLKEYDRLANIEWPLVHLKSASRYLHKTPEDIKATGGTNWQKYLPPNFQMIMFFPELWNDLEKQHWGRTAFQNMER
jgi:tryptophan 2,3-dioxygenase